MSEQSPKVDPYPDIFFVEGKLGGGLGGSSETRGQGDPAGTRAPEPRDMPWRPGTEEPGRVPPRICVQNARDALNQAFGQSDPKRALTSMITALDWQRRAIEQMVEADHA